MNKLSVFFHCKPVELLLAIRESPALPISEYARRTGAGFSHTFGLVQRFESAELLTRTRLNQRRSQIYLTGEGISLAKDFEKIMRMLK